MPPGQEISKAREATTSQIGAWARQLNEISLEERKSLNTNIQGVTSGAEIGATVGRWLPSLTLAEAGSELQAVVKDFVVFHGKVYPDKLSVPGNEPVAVVYPDNGQPVRGPDGKPVFAPSRADLPAVADRFAAQFNQNAVGALLLFGHNGEYDFQRIKDDAGRSVFTSKYKDFANIAIGYAFAQMNVGPLAAPLANTYCNLSSCKFAATDTKSPQFSSIPQRDVDDYKIGASLFEHAKLR